MKTALRKVAFARLYKLVPIRLLLLKLRADAANEVSLVRAR